MIRKTSCESVHEVNMRICWITNIPSPYKTQLFEEIGKTEDLLCIYEKSHESNREASWYIRENHKFQVFYWPSLKPSDLERISADYDCLINGDYTNPASRHLTRLFKKKGKAVILQADGGLPKGNALSDLVIRKLMSSFSYCLSSGAVTDEYFFHYGIPASKILHYRFTSLCEEDIRSNASMAARKAEFRQNLGIPEKAFVYLSVGQQIPRKGYDILARAAIGLDPSIRILIAGGTPESKVHSIIAENHIGSIIFVGFKDHESLRSYYAAADAFVLPTRYDIWGLVINEAMSYGLPFISTDRCVSALEFTRKGRCGIITAAENIEALHNAMEKLFLDADLRSNLSAESLRVIQDYSIENSSADIVRALHSILV